MADLADKIAEWVAGRAREAGREGAVLGLSGGLDSGVAAALCKRALGERALGVVMPCESDPRDASDAESVAKALGLRTVTVDLDAASGALLSALPEGPTLATANLKPRLRMVALYYLANKWSYLVCGSGNRSEIMTGYFTKHGDGAADILPLGGLYKTQVRELARELGVPEELIAKAPSAGLWEGQTDERELGMSYEELDRALRAIEAGKTEGIPPETLARVRKMVERSAHKRVPAPVFEPGAQ
jgi:NAD+ synthase